MMVVLLMGRSASSMILQIAAFSGMPEERSAAPNASWNTGRSSILRMRARYFCLYRSSMMLLASRLRVYCRSPYSLVSRYSSPRYSHADM